MIEMIGHPKSFEDIRKPIFWNHTTTKMEVIVVLVSFTPCHPMPETRAKKEKKRFLEFGLMGSKNQKANKTSTEPIFIVMIA